MEYFKSLLEGYIEQLSDKEFNSAILLDIALFLEEVDYGTFLIMLETLEEYTDLFEFLSIYDINKISAGAEEVSVFEREHEPIDNFTSEDDLYGSDDIEDYAEESDVESDEDLYGSEDDDEDSLVDSDDDLYSDDYEEEQEQEGYSDGEDDLYLEDESDEEPEEDLDDTDLYADESEEDTIENSEDDTDLYGDESEDVLEEIDDPMDDMDESDESDLYDDDLDEIDFGPKFTPGKSQGISKSSPIMKNPFEEFMEPDDEALDELHGNGLTIVKKPVVEDVKIFNDPVANKLYNWFKKL